MKHRIKRLRDMIKVLYPYRVYKYSKRLFAAIAGILFVAMIAFCFIEPKAIPYDQANDSDYAYLDIDYISSEHYKGYYIVEQDDYCYIYHHEEGLSQDLVDLQNGQTNKVRIFGVPDTQVSEDVLWRLIPIFNDIYADPVYSIEDLTYYTGYGYLDHDMTFNVYQIAVCLVFSIVFLLIVLLFSGVEKFYTKRFNTYFEDICYREEDIKALEELQHPIQAFYNLKAVLLPNYLVCNHPVPFMISYEDIVMIYEKHLLSKEIDLVIYDRHFKKKTILSASALNPKSHQEVQELLDYITRKYPKILVGNTPENRELMKQMKNNL